MFDDWRSGDDRYVSLLCKGCQIRTNSQVSLCHYQHPFIKSSPFPFIFGRFLPFCTPGNPPLSARPAEQLLALAQEPKLRGDQAWEKVAMPRKIAANFPKLLQNWEDLCHYVWFIYTTLLHVHEIVPGNKLPQDSTTCGFSRLKWVTPLG